MYEYPARYRYHFKLIGFKGHRAGAKDNTKATLENLFKLDNSLSRTRRSIQDFILCNKFDYFCTFTFSDAKIDRHDYDACKKALTTYFKNFRQRHAPEFRYLVVGERHKDLAWHFHGVIKGLPANEFAVPETIQYRNRLTNELNTIPNRKGYVRWERYSKRFGFFDCSLIKHYEACAMYVSKYIIKDLINFKKGSRLFFASQDLKKPVLVMDENLIPFPFDIKPTYEDQFLRVTWATYPQMVKSHLVDFFEGDQFESERPSLTSKYEEIKKKSRGQLEKELFEPLTIKQLSLNDYIPQENILKKGQENARLIKERLKGIMERPKFFTDK